MAKMTLTVGRHVDGESLVLVLNEGDKPLGHIIFDAPTAEKHIWDVARARAQLPEGVTPDLDVGARMEALIDPRWQTDRVDDPGFAAISLRHPGLGWVSFAFPAKEARALGHSLVAMADALDAKGDG